MSHAATATSLREQQEERKSQRPLSTSASTTTTQPKSHRRTASSPPPPVPPLPSAIAKTQTRTLHKHHHSLSSLRFSQSLSTAPIPSPSPSPRPDWAGSAIKRLRRERHVKSTLARVEALDSGGRGAKSQSPSTEDSAYETADDGSSLWLARKISTRDLGRRGSGRVRDKDRDKDRAREQERLLRARASAPEMAAQRWRERDRESRRDGRMRGEDEAGEDLFTLVGNEGPRSQSRVSVLASRQAKRQSLPGDPRVGDAGRQRPKSSGTVLEASSSRLQEVPSELSRHADRFRDSRFSSAGSVVSGAGREDSGSVVGRSFSGRTAQRHTSFGLRERLASPEVPHYGRRRPSFGALSQQQQSRHHVQNEARHHSGQSDVPSPADDSDPKPRSDSVDSQTSSSGVWDELDDLKSRIKKLEFSGTKMPPTPGAAVAVSGGSSERPRTATTAPTTIDSSPKADRKPSTKAPADASDPNDTTAVCGPGLSKIHPNLHSALAKAKTLLNPSLYRSLENTAADALQLAALTSSAGPQGTTFSAASIINGVTVSDRHVRRKADNMCRNLTDLCLALCDGKNDAPTPNGVVASPVQLESPTIRATPPSRLGSARYSLNAASGGAPVSNDRSSHSGNRPMSRLEARRSSILGTGSLPNSPRDYAADEGTPSGHPKSAVPHHMYDTSRRSSAGSTTGSGSGLRASSSLLRTRLSAARSHRHADDTYTEAGGGAEGAEEGEDDPTIRAPSRAMTDIGGLRSSKRQSLLSHKRSDTAIDEHGNDNGSGGFPPQRSPSLRSTFSSRRAGNLAAHDANARVSSSAAYRDHGSLADRRRSQLQPQAVDGAPPPPPVVAEEDERSEEEADGRFGGEREDGLKELSQDSFGSVNGKGREGSRSRRRIASLGPFGVGAGGRRVGSLS